MNAAIETEQSTGPLRIVLFGPAGAGKSTLVAALGRIQREFPESLNGELASDATEESGPTVHRLAKTSSERQIVSYPIRYRPAGRFRFRRRLDAQLIDTDGRIAATLLQRDSGAELEASNGVESAVWDADALVLAIPAAATYQQIDQLFDDLGRFLHELEQRRGARIEVSRFPVFVVLTKCDEIAVANDSVMAWMDRAQDRHELVRKRLEAFLSEGGRKRSEAFGRLDVHSWAVAAIRPNLSMLREPRQKPWNVAELLWQCLDAAQTYRLRRGKMEAKVGRTTAASIVVASILSLLIVLLFFGIAERTRNDLEKRIDAIRDDEKHTLEGRLHEDDTALEDKLRDLQAIRIDPRFGSLYEQDQEFVTSRIAELNEYLPWLQRLVDSYTLLIARSYPDLDAREKRLREGDLKPPREDWAETGAGEMHRRYLRDVTLFRERATRVEQRLRNRRSIAGKLWTLSIWWDPDSIRPAAAEDERLSWRLWRDATASFLKNQDQPWPEVRDLPEPGSVVTRYSIESFEPIEREKKKLDALAEHLKVQSDVSRALGLDDAGGADGDVLVVPNQFSPADASKKLAALRAAYPNYEKDFRLKHLSEAAQAHVARTARVQYRYLLKPAKELVLQQLRGVAPGENDSHAAWKRVADWLSGDPEELKDWRRLALTMRGLFQSNPNDPVDELAAFLKKDAFEFEVRTVWLDLPEASTIKIRVREREPLKLRIGERDVAIPYEREQPEIPNRPRFTRYVYSVSPPVTISLKPGTAVRASLRLGELRRLDWSRSSTATYPFECLQLPPMLSEDGEQLGFQPRVTLTLLPEEGVPTVPDLLPATRP